MKMKTRLFTFTVLGIALAACTNDTENLNDGLVAAQFTAAIGDNVTATTRVSGTDGTKWDKGDCIGITCTGGSSYNNVPYVTNNGDGNFNPASDDIIYYDNTDEVTFRAYYPYKDDNEMTEGKIAATTDAKAQEVQTRHDFLFANGAKGSTYNPDVSFTGANAFSHCMSRITLNFKGGRGVTIPTDGPTSYTLKGLLLQGTFDPTNGETATTANSAANVTLPGNRTSSIFFPQEVESIGMEILLNGNTYYTALPVKEDKLQSGKEYHYEITISHKDVMVNASIKAWDKVNENVNVNI